MHAQTDSEHRDAAHSARPTDKSAASSRGNTNTVNASSSQGTSPRSHSRIWEFIWQGETFVNAKRQIEAHPPEMREFIRRAQLAGELAGRALDGIDTLAAGSGAGLAVDLYGQAIFWCHSALLNASFKSRQEAWDKAAERGILDRDREDLKQLRGRLAVDDFREIASLSLSEQTESAEAAREIFKHLLSLCQRDFEVAQRVLVRRIIRSAALALLVLLFAFGAYRLLDLASRGPDLLAGKPWRLSSVYKPSRKDISIFFHTQLQKQPWIEYDLGEPTTFSRVDVKNRTDCCSERAVPLIIEASDDQKEWKQLARQSAHFMSKTFEFDSITARYLRLRVDKDKQVEFHLERVSAYK